jgi:hypothetical protein
MNSGFFELSLSIQVALASGYLAYITAYAGLRRGHATQDAIFISLVFSVVALLCFELFPIEQTFLRAAMAGTSALVGGILWRKIGRPFWLWIMRKTGVHREDGVHAPWDVLVQTDGKVGQLSVHLKNGRVLYLHDRRAFLGCPWEGLYLGGDGSVIMAVESEELPDGTNEIREAVRDDDWGTRMTYIPASEIARVNIRIK